MGGRGSGGHNKKTPAERIIEGNPGHRPIEEEAGAALELGELKLNCPRWLNQDARRMWRQVCRELRNLGNLKTIDRGVLAAYCSAWATFKKAEEVLNEEGFTQPARHGDVPRPEVKIAHEAKQQIRALGAELGLTPKSRGMLGAAIKPEKKAEDPLEKALHTSLRKN